MSTNDFLSLLTKLCFILLGCLTAIDYLLHKDKTRRDIALMFGSLALAFLIPELTRISGLQAQWVSGLGSIALVAQPYLLLRLVRYFRPLPTQLIRIALMCMLGSWTALVLAPILSRAVQAVFLLAIIAYFVGIDGYAMVSFTRGALTTSGVVKQRLRFAAAGSGLLALALVGLGFAVLVPVLLEFFTVFTFLAASASALSYYLGFAPPRWLRRTWQLAELRRFLLRISRKPIGERLSVADSLSELCSSASSAVGGVLAAVVRHDEAEQIWVIDQISDHFTAFSINPYTDGIITQATDKHEAMFIRASENLSNSDRLLLEKVGADTCLVASVASAKRSWGSLLVFLKYSSLFIEDDLDLVLLIAQQSAVSLENSSLVEELHHYSEQLEKKVEERTHELRESQEQYRRIVETAQEGIWVTDTENKTTFANARMAEMLGYTPDEFSSAFMSTFIGEENQALLNEKRERRRLGIKEQYEFKLRRKDHTDLYALVSTTPLTDEKGTYIGALAMVADITERKQAEDQILKLNAELEQRVAERTEQLRQSEAKFSKAFLASPAAISIATVSDGRWIEINEALAKMTGYDSKELIGRTSAELGLVDLVARAKILEAVREYGAVRNVEIQIHTKSKEVLDVLVSAEQIELNGQACALTIQYDITELKRAEKEVRRLNDDLQQRQVALEAVNKELEAFSYSVAHDLRAPLRSIDGFSQALQTDYEQVLDEEGQDFLRRIRAGSQRMGLLIDDLLMLSQLTRAAMRYETVNLSQLVHQIASELRDRQPERSVELVIQSSLEVQGDERLLRAMLVNLVSNAWKFTSKTPSARIEFGVNIQNETLVYFVRDNGAGFDMAYADKLFGAFQRLHKSTEFEGTGIGLATVQRIVNRHGGRIWAEGAINQGATFFFSFQQDQLARSG